LSRLQRNFISGTVMISLICQNSKVTWKVVILIKESSLNSSNCVLSSLLNVNNTNCVQWSIYAEFKDQLLLFTKVMS